MTAYVIATSNDQHLNTPVFHAGHEDEEEAVAVFTRRDLAEKYIEDAGWNDDQTVASLSATNLLRWLVRVNDDGSQFLVVDPDRASHLSGDLQSVMAIERELAGFAEILTRDILAKRLETHACT